MQLGLLYTRPLDDGGEIGIFECHVTVHTQFFLNSTDKSGLVKHAISITLASLVDETEVPADYWYFKSEPVLQSELNYPPILNFGARRV